MRSANADKEKTLKDGVELKKQLAAAKTASEKLQKEVQAANAAKEKALTEAKVLRQQLDEKERDLQQVRKQLESLTKANRVPPVPQDTTPAKGPTGTAPAGGAMEGP